MKKVFLITIAISFLNLGGCTLLSPSAPGDLKFISVRKFDIQTLPNSDKYDVEHHVNDPSVGKVLRVDFSSNGDIQKYNLNWNNPHIWIVACRDWKDLGKMVQTPDGGYVPAGPLPMDASSVYRDDVDVFMKSTANAPTRSGPFIYHFYIDINGKLKYRPQAAYDLNVNPQDVCFQIASAESFRPGAETNIVTIPKEAIVTALREKP